MSLGRVSFNGLYMAARKVSVMFSHGKKIAGLAFAASLIAMGTARAAVPQDALVVGGIEYGASESYVRSVYGSPHKVETKYGASYSSGRATEWEYGRGFEIVFDDGFVRHIEVDARNGIQTRAGIAVGTDVNTLVAAYGRPDALYGDRYVYFADEDQTIGFSFEIENDCVDEITMGGLRTAD